MQRAAMFWWSHFRSLSWKEGHFVENLDDFFQTLVSFNYLPELICRALLNLIEISNYIVFEKIGKEDHTIPIG